MPDHEARKRWNQFISAVVRDRASAGAMLHADPTLLNLRGLWGETPLHFLATEGETDGVRHLVGLGADLNLPNSYGDTPLLDCVRLGRVELAELLLNAGADPNIADHLGTTPLKGAAELEDRSKQATLVGLLVRFGADLNAVDHVGCTPLVEAAYRGDKIMYDLLIGYGADTELEDPAFGRPADILADHERRAADQPPAS